MILILIIIFILCILAILHSYLLYPLFLKLHKQKNRINTFCFLDHEDAPRVSILMSIYNEELVIAEKIKSILNSDYPQAKIELIIGSDNSSDRSNSIVEEYAQIYDNIKFYPFYSRQGKPAVINQIQKKATGRILILTDANVIFEKTTIFELAKHFKNREIGLVDSNMINSGLSKTGISIPESTYITLEVKNKHAEGNIWGTMMGPFGGCYAIRAELFTEVPTNFLVDDFYINMCVLEKGYKAINNLNAIVYEDVSNNFKDEFRRKIRIATGNFQNLNKFKHLLMGLFNINKLKDHENFFVNIRGLAFSFLSHKVLRWTIPFIFIILIFVNISLIFITQRHLSLFFGLSFLALATTMSIPFVDAKLKKSKINIKIFRFITHFYGMNLALLIGFARYIRGVKSGVWQPTRRHQATKSQ